MVDITELKQYNINISTGDRHMKEFVCELGEDFALATKIKLVAKN